MLAFLILGVVILLPIVPAYLLFKALPSTAEITGPWKGLQIKLGGAFGGYIIVLLIILHYHTLWSPYEVWQLNGQVVDQSGSAITALDPGDVTITPPDVTAPGAGQFTLMFNTSTGIGGQVQYPTVVIAHPGYAEQVISLDPSNPPSNLSLVRDSSKNTITVSKIVLEKLPTYPVNATPLNAAQPASPPDSAQQASAGGHQ